MSEYRRESHLRSLLKGISWRIVATTDTILVSLLVLWLLKGDAFEFDEAIGHAAAIGLYEFFIKLTVYYVHERVWENLRAGDGLDKGRTLKKSISWRIVATSMTFVIAAFVLGNGEGVAVVASTIAIVEFFTKFILYYVHERVWLRLPLGRIRRWFQRN